ncbi:hypothetical protein RUND412_006265 [Rhizina undulata]
MAAPRSYADAVTALNSLQTNFAILDAVRKSGRKMNEQAIPEMIEWARRIGYTPVDFNKLNPVHISGTKGKGSTSAFTASILSRHPSISKTGLYTSPHLRAVRERIQIQNSPLTEDLFAKYFFEVWDRMERSADAEGHDPKVKPAYFRFLTLVAFHTFLSEGVDTAVFEVGVGGEYDSTNIIEAPTVTGVTSLGIDHVAVLGNTIEEISWHKAGIFKKSAAAFTVPQIPAALEVLEKRAQEKKIPLTVVNIHPQIESGEIKLGLSAEFQKANASLAVALAAGHLKKLGVEVDIADDKPLPSEFKEGLARVNWLGRCQVETEENIEWHIDGAHTAESLLAAGNWFASKVVKEKTRILIFNQQTRDAPALIRELVKALESSLGKGDLFEHAIFCTNVTWKEQGWKPDLVAAKTDTNDLTELTVQKGLAQAWRDIQPNSKTQVMSTIEEAVSYVRSLQGREIQALVTGSLHLVGGFLEVIDAGK